MKTLRAYIVTTLTILLLQSCAYTWDHHQLPDGSKVWVRMYEEKADREAYDDKCVFKYFYKEEQYPKYAGSATTGKADSSTYIQFDSVRVYLFPKAVKYKSIFTSGLVDGQLLYCKMYIDCKPDEGPMEINEKTARPILDDSWDWKGHKLSISRFEELSYVKARPKQRRFKFYVHSYYHTNYKPKVFLLELTNSHANENTNLEPFIKGAKVTYISCKRFFDEKNK